MSDGAAEKLMQPVNRLLRFMTAGDDSVLQDVFAESGVSILDSFSPHLFAECGFPATWVAGFRASMQKRKVEELVCFPGQPQLLSVGAGQAYFSVPVSWRGTSKGKSFKELGVLTILAIQADGNWRIRNFSWGSASYEIGP